MLLKVEGSMMMVTKSRTKLGLGWLALVILAGPSVGCSSSKFSMPKMNMFSWGRKPDAATLAGNTQPAGLPVSPATKYDPATIASTTGKSSSGTVGSAYGYGATGSGTSGALAGQATQPGQPGLAASANGYQTGPYQLAPKTGTAPATTVASTTAPGSLPGGSLPNPYGGTYSGVTSGISPGTAAKNDVQLPSSVAAALNNGSAPRTPTMGSSTLPALPSATLPSATVGGNYASTPALPVGYANPMGGQVPASTSAYQMPGANSPGNFTLPSLPTASAGSSTIATGPTSGVPMPGAVSGGTSATAGLPAFPTLPSGSAGTTSTVQPAATTSSAYQGATTLGAYSPGSTGRTTSYDFSGGASVSPSGATGPSSPGGSLPVPPATTLPTGGSSLLR